MTVRALGPQRLVPRDGSFIDDDLAVTFVARDMLVRAGEGKS
jgi:hypothetical protein